VLGVSSENFFDLIDDNLIRRLTPDEYYKIMKIIATEAFPRRFVRISYPQLLYRSEILQKRKDIAQKFVKEELYKVLLKVKKGSFPTMSRAMKEVLLPLALDYNKLDLLKEIVGDGDLHLLDVQLSDIQYETLLKIILEEDITLSFDSIESLATDDRIIHYLNLTLLVLRTKVYGQIPERFLIRLANLIKQHSLEYNFQPTQFDIKLLKYVTEVIFTREDTAEFSNEIIL
jgi:hypothetical protein